MPTIRTKRFPDRPENNVDEKSRILLTKNMLSAMIGSVTKLRNFATLEGICCAPFDIERIYDILDIFIEDMEMHGSISYMLVPWSDGWGIWVNDICKSHRKRYILANALYYYANLKNDELPLFQVCGTLFCGEAITDKKQILAGEYTRELLMPEKAFRECIKTGMTSIHSLSDNFGVPTLAVRARAKELGLSGMGYKIP